MLSRGSRGWRRAAAPFPPQCARRARVRCASAGRRGAAAPFGLQHEWARTWQRRRSIRVSNNKTLRRSFLHGPARRSMSEELKPGPERLTFYALRHGQSLANVAGIISSAPEVALGAAHGLSDTGLEQARGAARE